MKSTYTFSYVSVMTYLYEAVVIRGILRPAGE